MALHSVLEEARRLHAAGEREAALNLLVAEMYDRGLDDELQAELQRLFPPSPDVLRRLDQYEARLNEPDAQVRQKAAKELSRIALGELTNAALHFLRHRETTGLFLRHLDDPDPVVREHLVIALAMCFQRYTRDDRAFEPLLPHLQSKSINTRAWAVSALAHLSPASVEHLLPSIDDRAERVRESAFSELAMLLAGGGIAQRPPLGATGRRMIRDALAPREKKGDAQFRANLAFLWAATAMPEDLPALQAWMKKDGSKQVKRLLQQGIERLQNPAAEAAVAEPPAPAPRGRRSKKTPVATDPAPATAAPADDPEFAPCQFLEGSDGARHCLLFTAFDAAAEIFEESGRDGGGYGWHGVLDALVRNQAPQVTKKLAYDPEASMLVVLSEDRAALAQAAALIRAALADPDLLRQALEQANPKLLDG